MHQQIRCAPTKSAADLQELLRILADKRINLIAAGGDRIEFDGEFAFVPNEDQFDAAFDALESAGYKPRLLEQKKGDFFVCWMSPDTVGELHRCVTEAAQLNATEGKVIRDILVGTQANNQGKIPVQIYSIPVKVPGHTGGKAAASRR
jgi:hypothetical protein